VKRSAAGAPVAKTSHTLNPVPFSIYDPRWREGDYQLDPAVVERAGLANVTATCLNLLGFERPDDEEPGLIEFS
jgi:2,3-bisphosphoglycerate-independent phosphoglycerate mutase